MVNSGDRNDKHLVIVTFLPHYRTGFQKDCGKLNSTRTLGLPSQGEGDGQERKLLLFLEEQKDRGD